MTSHTMCGLWLEDLHARYRTDIPWPEPRAGEAVVRVVQAGVCHTDIELLRGYYPFTGVIGHEFVGVVEQAADPALIGQRVCGDINVSCDACDECREGRPMHCTQRQALGISGRNGAFAEYLTLPERNLHVVPAHVTDDEAVFAEPLAAASAVLEQAPVHPTDRVVVIGPGKLGNLVAQVLALTGADVLVIGRRRNQLDLLAQLGIRTGGDEAIAPHRADLVVECTGNPSGLDLARRAVRPRGVIVLKSTYQGDARVNFSSIVVDEVTLVGSRCGSIPAALRLLAKGVVDVKSLIEARYALRDAEEALREADQPGRMKVLLRA